jgi:hypothetical protein
VTTSLCAWVDSLQNNLQNRCSQWKWLHIHKHITYTVWCCCTLSFCIHIDRCFVWRGLEVCCVMSIKFVHSWICPSICTLMIEDFEFFVSKYMFFSWSKIGEPVTCIDILHRELSPSLTSPRYIRTHVYAYMNCWNIFTNWAIHLPNRTFFLRIYWGPAQKSDYLFPMALCSTSEAIISANKIPLWSMVNASANSPSVRIAQDALMAHQRLCIKSQTLSWSSYFF